jgi:hypothetical protein
MLKSGTQVSQMYIRKAIICRKHILKELNTIAFLKLALLNLNLACTIGIYFAELAKLANV